MVDINKLLDSAEMVEWAKDHITPEVTKCLIIVGIPTDGGLDIAASQLGFQYPYELDGFVKWGTETLIYPEDD